MKILVLGARGMLGRDLTTVLDGRPDPHRVTGWDIQEIDITDRDAVMRSLGDGGFDVVINCAAYTAVDRAEQEKDAAFAINALGAGNVAAAARAAGARSVLISTDYVFDGIKTGPYREDDEPHPATHYGYTKMMGERFAREADPGCLIVRTQWLYGIHGKNFIETMLALSETRKTLTVVDDQHGAPTWTTDLSRALALLVEKKCTGIYHVSNSGMTTWCAFARAIFEAAGRTVQVVPITTEQYNAPAARPKNSVFDMTRFIRDAGCTPRHWTEALADYLILRSGHEAYTE